MHVVITGATGTIGRATTEALLDRGDAVTALTRSRSRAEEQLGAERRAGLDLREWSEPTSSQPAADVLAGADAVINLLGEPISQRWTPDAKRRIRDSRVLATRNLVTAIRALAPEDRPRVLVAGSATGIYGPRGDAPVGEGAAPYDDYLAEVVVAWEAEARNAEDMMRVALMRTGVVLSPEGGALAKMLPFFRLGIGGPVAGGRQYVPWVHLDDVVGALLLALDDERLSGPANVTAPGAATNADLSRALGHVLHRPAFLPVPGLALRALYGEMSELVTTGQRAVPRRLQEVGYEFRQPELEPALSDVLAGK
jgi:uncharacterized protein (TIGR01777 family)